MIIGSSKATGLYDRIGTTNLRSLDYGDKKSTPLITTKIPDATDPDRSNVWDLEVAMPVKAREHDVVRISKLLATVQGIKWEAHSAALLTIQNNLESKRSDPSRSTQMARSAGDSGFWKRLGSSALQTLKSAGMALVSQASLTASTLLQVAAAGTGEYQEPFLGQSYLQKNSSNKNSVLSTLVSSLGLGGLNNNISGIYYAKNGLEIPVDHSSPRYSLPDRVGNSSSYARFTGEEMSVDPKDRGGNDTKKYRTGEDFTYLKNRIADYPKYGESYTVPVDSSKLLGSSENREWTASSEKSEIPTRTKFEKFEEGKLTGKAVTVLDHAKVSVKYPEATKLTDINAEEDSGISKDFQKNFNMIPFEIQSVLPDNKYVLHFQANLDSYSDDYSANWSETSYVGRGDKFYSYGGFSRKISFSFKALALKEGYLKTLYKQLNLLAANTAPSYSDGTFMKGTLARVTIGDLLYRQYGMFSSIGFKWETDVPWEVRENVELTVPHMLSVSLSFIPIHNFNPSATKLNYFGHVSK